MAVTRYSPESTYTLCATSTAIAVIAAGTSTAGHLAALRYTGSGELHVHRVAAKWVTTTAFGAAQNVGLALYVLRSYTAAHSGGIGTSITFGTNDTKLWTRQTALADVSLIRSTVAELTAGTQTLDGLSQIEAYSDAPSTTPAFSMVKDYAASDMPSLRLRANEGLLLRNEILMGASGVAKVTYEMTFSLT